MSASTRTYSGVTSLVFLAVALVQGWRAISGFPVTIDGFTVPVVASVVLAVVALALAAWGFSCWRGARG